MPDMDLAARVAHLEADHGERIAELERRLQWDDYAAGYRRGLADGRKAGFSDGYHAGLNAARRG